MASLIGALRVTLSADTAAFSKGMSKAESQAKKSARVIENSMRGIRGAVSGLMAGISLATFVAIGKGALEYASSLGEVAQQLGVSTKALQEFRYAASQVGVSQEEMDKGLAKLTQTMGKARTGAEGPKKVFSELSKILGKDILTSATDAGDAIPMIADALAKIQDPAKRAAIEVALFGKAGQKLDTLLAGGGDAINNLRNAAHELGLVLSDEQIQSADETADKLSALKQVLEANIAGTVANNAESILALADAFAKLIVNIGGAIQQYSIWSNMQGFRNGDYGSTRSLLSTRSGRDAALNDLTGRLAQNTADRAANRGKRTSYLGGLIEVTDGATKAENAKLDSEFKALNEQRNRILELDRKLGADRPLGKPNPNGSPNIDLSTGGGQKDNSAAEAERARKDRLRDQHQFDMEIARAQMNELRAREDLAVETQDKASLALQQLDLEREIERKQTKFDLDMGDISQTQADQKAVLADSLLELQKQNLSIEADTDVQREKLRLSQEISALTIEGLELEKSMARTVAQRRDVEQRILTEKLKAERQAQQEVLDSDKTTADEKQAAARRLLYLDRNESGMRQQIDRDNPGPLKSYFDSLPQNAQEANEAFENVAAGGIQSMVDGLADAAVGARNLGDVFKNVAKQILADLIRIQIQKAIVGALGNLLGGIGGGGSGSTSLGLAGYGKSSVNIPKFATGGVLSVSGGPVNPGVDTNLLSINGQPRAMVSANERIAVIPNNAGGGRTEVVIMPTPYFDAHVDGRAAKVAAPLTVAGSQAAVGQAQSGMARRANRRLPG